jgi:hypothetical protein
MSTEVTTGTTTPAQRSESGLMLLVLAFVLFGVGAMFLV